jgi:hypothetical protein
MPAAELKRLLVRYRRAVHEAARRMTTRRRSNFARGGRRRARRDPLLRPPLSAEQREAFQAEFGCLPARSAADGIVPV